MTFKTSVITGQALSIMVDSVKSLRFRDCFSQLMAYLNTPCLDKVCILYGLRRTGKTTMLKQAVAALNLEACAYIKVSARNTMEDVEHDLNLLYSLGVRYAFIDEVTLMQEFIDSASILSDVFVATGMKVVLAGTDSLSFWLASDQELYDRGILIHTTYIPFHEHCHLLNTSNLDLYIQHGGILKAGEWDFEDIRLLSGELSFLDDDSSRRYIDTAICRNIQNSLAFYEQGGHFRHLYPLYLNGQLTNIINRIIEDMNHAFVRNTVISTLDPKARTSLFTAIDKEQVTLKLMELLSISNDISDISDTIVQEVREYLAALDLVIDSPVETVTGSETISHPIFTQPGMRFCQAKALVHAISKDPAFAFASEQDKALAEARILDEVRGRMMEDIVLLETSKFIPSNKRAFKLQFARGEFDMVVYDKITHSCEIYEVKHSNQTNPMQYRYLLDSEKCTATEHRFGPIVKRAVIYTGLSQRLDCGVEYLNVNGYLNTFSRG